MKNVFTVVLITMTLVLTGCASSGSALKTNQVNVDETNPYTTRSYNDVSVEQEPPVGYTPFY